MPSSGDDEVWPSLPAPERGGTGPFSRLPPRRNPAGQPAPLVDPGGPRTRGDAWVWLAFAVLGFVVGQVVALIAADVAAVATGNGSRLTAIENLAAPPAWYIGSSLVGLWVGFFLGPLLASRTRGTRSLLADMGLSFRAVDLLGVAIGLGGQLLVTLLYLPFISHLHNFSAPTTKLTGGAHGADFAVIAILTVLGAPFFEELFFRGLVLRGLLGVFGASEKLAAGAPGALAIGASVVLDGLLFGLAHGEFEQLAGLAVFGCVLALVAFRTQRLGMNMVAHATFNLVAVIAILSSRSGVVH